MLGVNYPEADAMGPGAIKIKEQYPELAIMSTESASYFSTRGIYKDNEENCQCSNLGSLFSMILPGKRQPGDPGAGGTQFGIADLCGFPKDYYYYYQANWKKEPVLHILPHWNEEGLEINTDRMIAVRVFSNADEVEIFVNGISFGKKIIIGCIANWEIPYQAGE